MESTVISGIIGLIISGIAGLIIGLLFGKWLHTAPNSCGLKAYKCLATWIVVIMTVIIFVILGGIFGPIIFK